MLRKTMTWVIVPVAIATLGAMSFFQPVITANEENIGERKDSTTQTEANPFNDDLPTLVKPNRLASGRASNKKEDGLNLGWNKNRKSASKKTPKKVFNPFAGNPLFEKHKILQTSTTTKPKDDFNRRNFDDDFNHGTNLQSIKAFGPNTGDTVPSTQPTPEYRKSVGAQTAGLAVDWVTPETIVVGKEGSFDLVLRNLGRVAVEQIKVKNVLPQGFRFVRSNPAPIQPGVEPAWVFEKLAPQGEARISLILIPSKVGDAQSRALVDFRTSATAKFKVVQPKLHIVSEGPKEALVGGQAIFNITVQNPGSGKTKNTSLKVFLPKGLTPIARSTNYDLGILNPGESRTVRVLAKVNLLGNHDLKFVAVADGGLRDEVRNSLMGLGAKLDVDLKGPNFRYVTRPATYKVRIKNTGTANANNVYLRCNVPRAFAYLTSGKNGRFDSATKSINWFIGNLEVGKVYEGEFKLRAVDRGNFPIFAQAVAERGLAAEDKHTTRVEGIAAILLEVVDVDDPIEVGAETYYEVLVTNQVTEFAKDVKVKAVVPDGIRILDSKGPTRGRIVGQTIEFDAISKLAPRADAIYRIKVKTSKAGDQRVEVQVTSATLKSPVKELESTKVYRD